MNKFKSKIAILLVVAMTLSNGGVTVLASSVDDVINETQVVNISAQGEAGANNENDATGAHKVRSNDVDDVDKSNIIEPEDDTEPEKNANPEENAEPEENADLKENSEFENIKEQVDNIETDLNLTKIEIKTETTTETTTETITKTITKTENETESVVELESETTKQVNLNTSKSNEVEFEESASSKNIEEAQLASSEKIEESQSTSNKIIEESKPIGSEIAEETKSTSSEITEFTIKNVESEMVDSNISTSNDILFPQLNEVIASESDTLLGAANAVYLPDIWYNLYSSSGKSDIRKIVIGADNTPPASYDVTWDINSDIKGYISGSGSNKTIYIIKNDNTKEIYLPSNGSATGSGGWFRGFRNLTEIENINLINTSEATNFTSMFNDCRSLTNLDLSSWDSSNVRDMAYMFNDCRALQSVNVGSFNTNNLQRFEYMFSGCYVIQNIDLSNFNTTNVTHMYGAFYNCYQLRNLDISSFRTSNVVDMRGLFGNCNNLSSINVSHFDTRNVSDMSEMFFGCSSLTNLDLSNFNTSNVTNMVRMFKNCEHLTNLNIASFDTSHVSDMTEMFRNCKNISNIDLTHFNTSQATNMSYMFEACESLSSIDLKSFDTSQVRNMSYMFQNCKNLTNLDLTSFDLQALNTASSMNYMFKDCQHLNQILVKNSFVPPTICQGTSMFSNCNNIVGEKGTTYSSSNVNVNYCKIDDPNSGNPGYLTLFYYTLAPTWYNNANTFTSKTSINSIKFLHYNDATPATVDFSFNLNDSNGLKGYIVNDGSGSSPYSIYIYPPENYKIYSAVDSSYLFSDVSLSNAFTTLSTISNISYFNTEKTTNMSYMFFGAGIEEFNENTFNTSNVTLMAYMFSNMPNILSINIESFDTANVSNMSYMFSDNPNLTNIDFGNIDTTNVLAMNNMFYNDTSITKLELGDFDTANVSDMSAMFKECTNLKTIIATARFVTTALSASGDADMFTNCNVLEGGNGTKYADKYASDQATAIDKTYAWIDGYQGTEGYFTEKYYVLSNDWARMGDRRIDYSSYNKSDVASISFVKSPVAAPSTYLYKWDLPDSNGLEGYVIDSETAGLYDIIVYAPEDFAIYTSENAKFMFSVDTVNDSDRFINCKEIKNLNYLNTSKSTDFDCMFIGMRNLQGLDLSGFDTSNATTMMNMFQDLRSIKRLDLSSFNVENVETMYSMFEDCRNLESIIFSTFNSRSLIRAERMFYNDEKLTALDLSTFVTTNVTNMSSMFYNCKAMTNLDLSSFDTSNVTTMASMFYGMEALRKINLSSFNTRNLTAAGYNNMFNGLKNIEELDLSSFSSNLSYINPQRMFYNDEKLKTIYVSTGFPGVRAYAADMFYNCQVLVGGAGTRWADQSGAEKTNGTYGKIDTPTNPGYFTLFNFVLTRDWTGDNTSQYIGVAPNISTYTKNSIEEITFEKYPTTIPANVNFSWDLPGSKGLKGYIYDTNKIMIYAPLNSDIYAATNSDALFSSLSGSDRAFSNVKRINNLTYLNTSKAEKMSNMFLNMKSLESLDLSGFDTASVSEIEDMFRSCELLQNLDLTTFDVDNIASFENMFRDCKKLESVDISSFVLTRATTVANMFRNCATLSNIDFSHKNTNSLVNMGGMFQGCKALQSVDFTDIDTRQVTTMENLFSGCEKIETMDLSNFDVSNVRSMRGMFQNMTALRELNLEHFDTWNVNDMRFMFHSDENLKTIYVNDLWSTYNVSPTNGTNMFNGCNTLEGIKGTKYSDVISTDPAGNTVAYANIDRGTYSPGFLTFCYYLGPEWYDESITGQPKRLIENIIFLDSTITAPSSYILQFDIPNSNGLKGYLTASVTPGLYNVYVKARARANIMVREDASYLFSARNIPDTFYDKLHSISNLHFIDTSRVKNMSHMFDGCHELTLLDLRSFDTSNVTDMSYMFYYTYSMQSIDVSNFDTSKVENMSYMYSFNGLANIDLSNFNTASVSDMSHMFQDCQWTTSINVSGFNTSNVTNMAGMFAGCYVSSTLTGISGFDTSKVTNMNSMFRGCLVLSTIDVSGFDTSNVTDMSMMFRNCSVLTSIDVTHFNTSNVTSMESLFQDCQALTLLDLSFFDTRNVLNMKNMFKGCNHLVTLHGSTDFVVTQVTDDTDMFAGCLVLDGGAGTTYASNYAANPTTAVSKQFAWIDMHQGRPGYFDGILKMVNVNLKANGGRFEDGSENKRAQIAEFTTTAIFEEPKRVGYEFVGYEVDGSPLEPNWTYGQYEKDVIAKWNPINYKIIYSANGGTGSMDVQIATYGTTYKIKENNFTKSGFEFGGFAYDGHIYQKDDEVSNLTTENNAEIIMLALWNSKNYKISYHSNGGSGNMADEIVAYGINHTIRANSFTRNGYTFNGWSTSANSAVAYGNAAIIFANEEYREEINLYAVWIKNTSIFGTLELQGNGGYINGVSTFTMHYYENQAINDVSKYRAGFEFSEWLDVNDVVTEYPNICTFSNTKILKANWNENTYKIVYHSNNGASATYEENVLVSATSHNLKTIAELTWTKQNHRFDGWAIRSDFDTAVYNDGEDIGQGNVERIDLYAVWTGYTYTITLNEWNKLATGTGRNKTETFTYGENKNIAGIATNSYIEAGIEYLFKAWEGTTAGVVAYLDRNSADQIFEDLGGNIDGATITLNSLWIEAANSNRLVIDGNGGSIAGKKIFMITLAINETIPYATIENSVYRKNYRFDHWLDTDKTTAFNNVVADWAGTKIIYADWTLLNAEYTLKYVALDKDNTSPTMADETKPCTAEFNLTSNTFTRLGYDFAGWDTSEDADTVVYKNGERVKELGDVGDIVTLYAVWTDKVYKINFYDYNNVLVGTASFVYKGSASVRPNNIPIGKLDAGYKWTSASGEKYFYSGQRVSRKDFDETTTTYNLYGEVADKIYRATFNANGGRFDDGTNIKIVELRYLDPVVLPNNVSRTSYNLGSWQVNGADFTGNTYSYDDDVTFIVRWTGGPTPAPTPGPSGGGSGGGGRGSAAGGGLGTDPAGGSALTGVIDLMMHYKIPKSNYVWEYNAFGERVKLKVLKSDLLIQVFKSSTLFSNRYEDIANENYVILKKGFYRIDQFDGIYVGLDNSGNIITGFVITDNIVKNFDINLSNAALIDKGDKSSAKYYLESNGLYRGMVWNMPKILSGVCYIFDNEGRVIKETMIDTNAQISYGNGDGQWEYDAVNDCWKYFKVNVFGGKEYYKGLSYILAADGTIKTYIFDENGIMKTGLVVHNGKTYLLQHIGYWKGAAAVGETMFSGQKMVFNELGELQ